MRPEIRSRLPGAGRGATDAGLCGACGLGLVTSTLGRLRDPPWGHYGPCARCSLTPRVIARDTQARPGAERLAKGLARAAAERREARRPTSWPVISGDPEMGPPRDGPSGAAASAPAPVGALLPSLFWGVENERGTRPLERAAARWLSDNRIGGEKAALAGY